MNNPQGSANVKSEAASVESWWMSVRRQTMKNVVLESALSWPVPKLVGRTPCFSAFYYGVKRVAGPGTGLALPPVALLTAAYPEARILGFIHRKTQVLFPGLPDTGELGKLVLFSSSPRETMQVRRALFEMYTPIALDYFTGEENVERKMAFHQAFWVTVEPALVDFYRALNPQFFDWLASNH